MVLPANTEEMPVTPRVVVGRLEKLLYRGKGIAIAAVTAPGEQWVVAPKSFLFKRGFDLIEGSYYRCTGRLLLSLKRGLQFHVSEYLLVSDTQIAQGLSESDRQFVISSFLDGKVPGVGPATAKRLYAAFGIDLLFMPSHEPLQTLSGIGERKAFMVLANLRRFIDELNA